MQILEKTGYPEREDGCKTGHIQSNLTHSCMDRSTSHHKIRRQKDKQVNRIFM